MCRLYAGEGNRQKERTRIDISLFLEKEDMELLAESARQHREWQRKQGDTADCTESDEIRWAVKKYLDELRRAGKGALDAESDGNTGTIT